MRAEPAGLLWRWFARFLDSWILALALLPGVVVLILLAPSDDEWLPLIDGALVVVGSLAYPAYFIWFETRRGYTPGKSLCRLRVMGERPNRLPTWSQSFRRNAWSLISLAGLVPVVGLGIYGWGSLLLALTIGVSAYRDKPHHRGWHDTWAGGTRIVRIHRAVVTYD